MRAHIAEQFGLPASDIPVFERGFRVKGEQLTHVCSIGRLPSLDHLLFLASVNESNGNAIVWRTGRNGNLLATVEFRDGIAHSVPNSKFETKFSKEVDYFLAKAVGSPSNVAPSPSAPVGASESATQSSPPTRRTG